MKVRCGEEKPSCRRCIDANRHCPGYGPAPDIFRYAKVASRNRASTDRANCATDGAEDTNSNAVSTTTLGENNLSTDWEAYGVSMFIHHYTVPKTSDIYRGHMEALPDFYSANTGVSHLHNAMLSVSLALLAHHTANEDLIRQARKHRSAAINELQYALKDKREASSDQVLLALFLLERFEVRAFPLEWVLVFGELTPCIVAEWREPISEGMV